MTKQMVEGYHIVRQRFFWMVGFALLFIAVGVALPNLYHKYLDSTEYYSLSQPLTLDKKIYAPCETQTWLSKRMALIDFDGEFTTTLRQIEPNLEEEQLAVQTLIFSRTSFLAVSKNPSNEPIPISGTYTLPCNLQEGQYFWQGVVEYKVAGTVRQYSFITDRFTIIRDGGSQ